MMADRERHVLPRVKTTAYYILLSLFAFSFCVGLWVWSRKGFEEATLLLGLSGFFLIAIPLARMVLPKYFARFYHRKLALHGTAIETKFAPSGIHSAGGGISSDMEWRTVIKLTRTPRHFFFWVNKVQAIIIPLRTMPDEADQQALWALAEQNFAGANK
ncbi:YcxB family protein [Ahrensia sp. R2A130]|uniref:YcxB family protein n=1 Tax=Ahrensia sp. R2A130 TaxID=744979 RepID=UPI0018DD46B5|nr:YcxB family protein [Ahrensia sp. R2A130]